MEQSATAERKEPPMQITFFDMRLSQPAIVHAVRSSEANNGATYYEIPGDKRKYSYDSLKPLALARFVYRVLDEEFHGEAKFEKLSEKCAEILKTEELDAHIAADSLIDASRAEWIPCGIKLKQKT